ncbi:LytTR family DNA-binding domain-containing protein [Streptococcaceae bacterium ESL0729]|nr:LytTR family DNA-binding domain-containing protein [Streptococcaceae bacterium ESL0729]
MVKIYLEIIPPGEEEEISCRLHALSDFRKELLSKLEVDENIYFLGKKEGKLYKLSIDEIFYVESVDKKTFAYSEGEEFELDDRLYVIEDKLKNCQFIRISKSMLVNIEKISMIHPSLSGRFEAQLTNGERVKITRKYVPDLKRAFGLGGDK